MSSLDWPGAGDRETTEEEGKRKMSNKNAPDILGHVQAAHQEVEKHKSGKPAVKTGTTPAPAKKKPHPQIAPKAHKAPPMAPPATMAPVTAPAPGASAGNLSKNLATTFGKKP
jgi:hypothetical protein